MNHTLSRILVPVVLLLLFFSCKTPIEPDFSYSPEMPRAGQLVKFTNLTESGEHWNWTYGDGGTSTLKNPTYTYKKPGIYDVTLRADSNDNYVVTKQITIYDTIPSVYCEEDSVIYYEDATFSAIVYNPYNYSVTYEWEFPESAVGEQLTDGKSEQAEVTVYFSQRDVTETVKLKITVGEEKYQIQQSYYIHDRPQRSLLMAGSDGKIYRQRLFDRGIEMSRTTELTVGKHPFTLQTKDNQLYVFDAGENVEGDLIQLDAKPGTGSITRISLSNNTATELIHNRNTTAVNGFYTGFVNSTYLYWSDFSRVLYRTPLTTLPLGAFEWKGSTDSQSTLPYYLVKVDRLGYYGNGLDAVGLNSGVYEYDNVYFWAKGGQGKGIYRFTNSAILPENVIGTGISPSNGAILTDFAIRSFAIDHINQKIYFAATAPAEKAGFWVANISGNNPVRIDNAPVDNPHHYITGIAIDHTTGKVYWAYRAPTNLDEAYFQFNPTHRTGVKMVKLATNYSVDKDVKYFSTNVSAYGIAIDEVKRF